LSDLFELFKKNIPLANLNEPASLDPLNKIRCARYCLKRDRIFRELRPTPPSSQQVDKKSPGNMAKRGGDWAELGVGKVGRVDWGPILLKKSILILLFLILWTRRQIELIFELKKVM
jgi:hypothetical protein